MRALLWIVLVATAAWTGYWWVGASTIETGVKDWIAQQPDGAITTSGVEVHGVPNRFDLTMTEVAWRDPASGFGIRSPFVQVYAMTWKPWHVIAALPSGQVITTPDQQVTVSSTKILASVQVHPSSALALSEVVGEAHEVVLASDAGWKVGIEKAVASSRENAAQANTYQLGLEVKNITPDPTLMQALAATDLPPTVPEIHIDAYASLTAPLDRFAAKTRPKLTGLQLTEVRLNWGALHFSAKGALTAGPDGLAVGEIAFRVEGWRRLPPILAALGIVKPDIAPTIERAMEVMAAQSGDPEVLEMTLICADGRMDLGPLPLGPAPQMN